MPVESGILVPEPETLCEKRHMDSRYLSNTLAEPQLVFRQMSLKGNCQDRDDPQLNLTPAIFLRDRSK
jgi:hypothetical protein